MLAVWRAAPKDGRVGTKESSISDQDASGSRSSDTVAGSNETRQRLSLGRSPGTGEHHAASASIDERSPLWPSRLACRAARQAACTTRYNKPSRARTRLSLQSTHPSLCHVSWVRGSNSERKCNETGYRSLGKLWLTHIC